LLLSQSQSSREEERKIERNSHRQISPFLLFTGPPFISLP
ncbi:hypothetical protein Gogos_020892, partial [Gossypium gossypioides]|nr:hypothetical protein [Gossypium gossypioides]